LTGLATAFPATDFAATGFFGATADAGFTTGFFTAAALGMNFTFLVNNINNIYHYQDRRKKGRFDDDLPNSRKRDNGPACTRDSWLKLARICISSRAKHCLLIRR
jgi:hypothetical protein